MKKVLKENLKKAIKMFPEESQTLKKKMIEVKQAAAHLQHVSERCLDFANKYAIMDNKCNIKDAHDALRLTSKDAYDALVLLDSKFYATQREKIIFEPYESELVYIVSAVWEVYEFLGLSGNKKGYD